MYFPEVSVDGVFESVHIGRCYNMLRESIPFVYYTLAEIVMLLKTDSFVKAETDVIGKLNTVDV